MIFGQTEFFQFSIIVFSITVAVSDLLFGKIYNWITLPAALLGVVAGFYFSGASGSLESVLAIGLGFLAFGWMFFMGFMGGGDVKALMAIGALGGITFTWQVALMSILVGAVIGVLQLIFKRRLRSFANRTYLSVVSVLVPQLKMTLPNLDRKQTMPFGLAIAVSATWIAFKNPLGGVL